MDLSEFTWPIPIGRKKTDKSLERERIKTDDALKDLQKASAEETDAAIQSELDLNDAELNSFRNSLDSQRASDLADPELTLDREIANAEEQIAKERQCSDKAIEAEQNRVKAAIRQERRKKRSMEKAILDRERRKTDRDLSYERHHTDIGFQNVNQLLQGERSAHLETKTALTTRENLIAIVSHDLRNPIGTILSSADFLLKRSSSATLGLDTRQWIERIQRNANYALHLIGNLLDMERISAGKLDLHAGDYDLVNLAKQTLENFSSAAIAKSIKLKFETSASHLAANCDPDRIMQVLSNLLSNAIKFTPKHGLVTLLIRTPEADAVEVAINDTGPGIPDEMSSYIFERFSQLEKKDRSGLGLGLYISKQIIDAHHGKLWADSNVGRGSTFTFTLPRKNDT